MTNKTFLTTSEVKKLFTNEEIIEKNTRYYRTLDYIRHLALTAFIEDIEKKYGDSFKLKKVAPEFIKKRSENNERAVFSLGLWASFVIDDIECYIEINENPFFNSYITKSIIKIDSPSYVINKRYCKMTEYIDDGTINEELYANIDLSNNIDGVKQFVINLHTAFNRRYEEGFKKMYKQNISSYEIKVQTIYGLGI